MLYVPDIQMHSVYDDESVSIKDALAEIIEDVKNSASDFIRGNVRKDSIVTELDYESFSFALSTANET